MQFDEYADFVDLTYNLDDRILDLMEDPVKAIAYLRLDYCASKLNGEAGEFIEEVSKSLRDSSGDIGPRHEKMVDELGDVLWYVFACARELGVTIEDVMSYNVEKLEKRSRGKLKQ